MPGGLGRQRYSRLENLHYGASVAGGRCVKAQTDQRLLEDYAGNSLFRGFRFRFALISVKEPANHKQTAANY